MTPFFDRLTAAVKAKGTPLVVGLDPRRQLLPQPLLPTTSGFDASAAAYRRFCLDVIDVVAPLVPAVKPQVAFFEQLGWQGMRALADVVAAARKQGLLVILDAKRNDIGSTAEGYADGWLGETSAWQADALTVSPYLGDDSLDPFLQTAETRGAGLFVLVKTSNPGGRFVQDISADGTAVYQHVGDLVEKLAKATAGQSGFGIAGAVVGATYPDQLAELRQRMPHSWFLVPGFGSQGGTAADVAAAFDDRGLGAVINSSRTILSAHARSEYAALTAAGEWQRAVDAATRDAVAELQTVVTIEP